jgi:urea transport system permease protein
MFGAQNVQVENPSFMSGGIQVLSNVVLPWNRVFDHRVRRRWC